MCEDLDELRSLSDHEVDECQPQMHSVEDRQLQVEWFERVLADSEADVVCVFPSLLCLLHRYQILAFSLSSTEHSKRCCCWTSPTLQQWSALDTAPARSLDTAAYAAVAQDNVILFLRRKSVVCTAHLLCHAALCVEPTFAATTTPCSTLRWIDQWWKRRRQSPPCRR